MSDAIEKLAAELFKLPADEWTRLDARRTADQDREAVMGQVPYREFAARLREIERAAARAGDQE